jgi:transposase InsO family protein
MPWKKADVQDQRIEFVLRASRKTEPLGGLCREFGVHRSTGHRWLKRYASLGSVVELKELSRRPHLIPNKTIQGVEDRVLELRRQYGWGARKLQVLLRREGVQAGPATVHRILKRRGVIGVADPTPASGKRFEREAPNELWQMDFKGLKDAWFRLYGKVYPLTILDDHSRFVTGLFALDAPDAAGVSRCLRTVFDEVGLPDAMLMDHGTPWWNHSNGYGLTQLSVNLMKQGIRLYFGAIRHPQTQGKVERLHRTLEEALQHATAQKKFPGWQDFLKTFREEYNHLRPHEALNLQTPAARYRRSPRSWNPCPPAWDYGSTAWVSSLNTQGSLLYECKRYYVCRALASEDVALERLENRLLVRYRRTWIREIDLCTGKTMPIVSSCHRLPQP